MRLEQLHYLIEIAHSKSISIAAENLYISQPALSRAVKALEDELGLALLFRTVDGVRLTQAGEYLLPAMQDVLAKTQIVLDQAQDFCTVCHDTDIEAQLTILTLSTISDSLLPIAIEQFNRMYPLVNVSVELFASPAPFALSTSTDADLLLTMNINNLLDSAIDASGLHCEPLFVDNFSMVVSQTHQLANKKTITLDEAIRQRLVLHQHNFSAEEFFSKLTPLKQPLDVVLRSNNSRTILDALLKRNTALVTNSLLIRNDYAQNPNLRAIPIKNCRGQFFGLYNANHVHVCLIKQIIEFLKSARTNI